MSRRNFPKGARSDDCRIRTGAEPPHDETVGLI
jgi:hypothetical protein